MSLLTVYSGDTQQFRIQVYAQDGVTAVTPLSGTFMIKRVNDDSTVLTETSGITIASNIVTYNWCVTGIGFMSYIFSIQLDETLRQTTKQYFQAVAK